METSTSRYPTFFLLYNLEIKLNGVTGTKAHSEFAERFNSEKKPLEISAVLEGVVLAKWLHFFYKLALAVHSTYISTTTKQMGGGKLSSF